MWKIARLIADDRAQEIGSLMIRHQAGLSLYRQFMEPGDLVFDLGANVGDRTALFRELGATVVAVDPQPSSVKALKARFADDPGVDVVGKAVAAAPGTFILHEDEDSVLSSISTDWIEAVRASGRFKGAKWSRRVEVAGTTLDSLIHEFGIPQFCKIDVEGSEAEVLAGLSQPLPSASFELHAETFEITLSCFDAFSRLGPCEFAFSYGESMMLGRWESAERVLTRLRSFPDQRLQGDVYVRSTSGG